MFSKIPPVTRALLIANVVVFLLQWLAGESVLGDVLDVMQLWPIGAGDPYGAPSFMPWQLLTYAFMHGSIQHLFFNMLALVMFGSQVEHVWGARRYLGYYLTCVVGAAICQLAVGYGTMAMGGEAYPTVGASGAIFGLLLAYGMLFPQQRVMLLIPPVPMKARTLVIVYGVLELLMGITGTMPGVAHFAHLGGMLFGWLLIRYWRRRPPSRGGRNRPPNIRIVH
ncbi:rhomboid family intramembrane serine protease [Lysobacter sp. TY2-98]|uniref:rhomboid family intramembrane serine protease n=1 Tax=Lysobacter sp. TY2-98 TaxID=2290922 RepID=UPI000E20C273|nr:rhomboid family intramembrane serine protease [Lysobacter sp. TY2-98]AXK71534.1 rhomboid family intramembrane serine protease [Lysobacter sp. TY2-98]